MRPERVAIVILLQCLLGVSLADKASSMITCMTDIATWATNPRILEAYSDAEQVYANCLSKYMDGSSHINARCESPQLMKDVCKHVGGRMCTIKAHATLGNPGNISEYTVSVGACAPKSCAEVSKDVSLLIETQMCNSAQLQFSECSMDIECEEEVSLVLVISLTVGIILAIVMLGGVAGYFFMRAGKNDTPQSPMFIPLATEEDDNDDDNSIAQ